MHVESLQFWQTVKKEYYNSARDVHDYLICERSETFKKVWNSFNEGDVNPIKALAEEFLEDSKFKSRVGHSFLFLSRTFSNHTGREIRVAFLDYCIKYAL
jgi:hypothetical protein